MAEIRNSTVANINELREMNCEVNINEFGSASC